MVTENQGASAPTVRFFTVKSVRGGDHHQFGDDLVSIQPIPTEPPTAIHDDSFSRESVEEILDEIDASVEIAEKETCFRRMRVGAIEATAPRNSH